VLLSEMLRELNVQQEQLELQAHAAQESVTNLRQEVFAEQAEDVRTLLEHIGRASTAFGAKLHEVTKVVDSHADSLLAELRQEVEQLRQEIAGGRAEKLLRCKRLLEDEDAATDATCAGESESTMPAGDDIAAMRDLLQDTRDLATAAYQGVGQLAVELDHVAKAQSSKACQLRTEPADPAVLPMESVYSSSCGLDSVKEVAVVREGLRSVRKVSDATYRGLKELTLKFNTLAACPPNGDLDGRFADLEAVCRQAVPVPAAECAGDDDELQSPPQTGKARMAALRELIHDANSWKNT
jgi:hypothetical protein